MEHYDYMTRRRPQAIAAIVKKIKEDFEIEDDLTDDELNRILADIATTAYDECRRDLTEQERHRVYMAELAALERSLDWVSNLNHNLSNVFNLSL